MENFVFGDTGGHARQLYTTLSEIGVDVERRIVPEGVRIIHCGDLIHKGKDSSELLSFVNDVIRRNPGQWIQMLGNHEFQHIEGAPYFWRCQCTLDDVGIINDLYDDGLVYVAFGVDDITLMEPQYKIAAEDSGGLLFSHAGMTESWWKMVGFPDTPSEAAAAINNEPVFSVTRPGEMMNRPSTPLAGPVWASSGELFLSWWRAEQYEKEAPFSQVFGHTTSYVWSMNRWYATTSREYKRATKLDVVNRVSMTHIAGKTLFGVDPGYATHADTARQPYLYFES